MELSLLILAIIAAGMLAIFWICYLIEWRGFLMAKRWESASATIVSSRVVGSRTNSGTMTGRVFSPEIIYEFEHERKALRGRKIQFGGLSFAGSLARAKRTCEKFPAGRVLPLYFGPGKPEKCVLLPKDKGGLWTMGILLFALSFVPALFWAFFYMLKA
ncbi:hypothetical protein TSACC_23075 [Terrimicrobium sacchariphilum]|uniref:DUF3592 domain-containing protein n=1 Tax=Terrimicrobium sacchariphilum TaxID=690879 RepID=A0A146GBP9_TERSA|nr:DUF3592 domain-containing protein [Terrimicrobium sacchariphilum]GAT34643.1 hypothetical protein TSACC_23075 [Terrimicrobium sacchariphilum]